MKMPKYFDQQLPAGFLSLYTSRSILSIGSGLIGIFFPIFLYQLFGNNVEAVNIYYVSASILYIILLGFTRIPINKIGLLKTNQSFTTQM